MSIRLKPKKNEIDSNNIFWTTMSDLMLGLSIIFITLFVLAVTGFSRQNMEVQKKQMEMSKELVKKLNESNIKADVDKMTGDVRISDLDLFEVNSYTLSPRGKAYLGKLVPIYINTIYSKKEIADNIQNIVIQGYTDSQMYAGLKSKDAQFMKNMELSLNRANAVANYMFLTKFDKKYDSKLMTSLTVEGRSFNDPILVNGKEDFAKSRRVELRLKLKKWDIMEALGHAIKNDK
ncbi:MAG: OmpA family protein [Clostridiaceae bacterium]|jgi:chemotaxis protein MotB|nr:OmpA family protein [Clostridiaceae bacterium]